MWVIECKYTYPGVKWKPEFWLDEMVFRSRKDARVKKISLGTKGYVCAFRVRKYTRI